MRIRKQAFISLTFVLLMSACSTSLTPHTYPQPPVETSKLLLEQMSLVQVPGLAIAKIEKGKISWVGVYGKVGEGKPTTQNSVFNIASLTKPMFAMLALHIDEDGVFELDTPLKAHWIDPDVANDPNIDLLTMRLALSHQTGFPNWRGNRPLTFAFAPGERHEYSGEGFQYAQRALEKSTNKTMPELMKQYITGPLSLNDTYFGWDDSIGEQLVTGYDESAQAYNMAKIKQRSPSAACCTFSTITDYAKFIEWVVNGGGLSKWQYKKMRTPQHADAAEKYGLGWRLILLKDRTILSHDGREKGVRTLTYVDNKTNSGLVVFTNSSNGELLMRSIVESTLPMGSKILHQNDKSAWHYISSLPIEEQEQTLTFIASSPTYTSTLLYGVDAALIEKSKISLKRRQLHKKHIGQLIIAAHRGTIVPEQLVELFSRLNSSPGKSFQYTNRFSSEQANAWVAEIEKLAAAKSD